MCIPTFTTRFFSSIACTLLVSALYVRVCGYFELLSLIVIGLHVIENANEILDLGIGRSSERGWLIAFLEDRRIQPDKIV